MAGLKVSTALICEDVRVERSGKHIIIGVFAANIVVAQLPAFFPFMIWLQIEEVDVGEIEFEFRARLSGHSLATGGFTTNHTEKRKATVPLGPFPVELTEKGDLTFDIKYKGRGRWAKALTIPVEVRTPPTS